MLLKSKILNPLFLLQMYGKYDRFFIDYKRSMLAEYYKGYPLHVRIKLCDYF